jgi:hypothetical protein
MTARHTSHVRLRVALAAPAVAALLLAGCGSGDGDTASSPESEGATTTVFEAAAADFAEESAGAAETTTVPPTTFAAAEEEATADVAQQPTGASAVPPVETIDPALVSAIESDRLLDRDVTVEIELDGRTFQQAWADLNAIPARFGGLVASAAVTPVAEVPDGEEEAPESGTLAMRVPVANFQAARDAVAELGRVTSESSTTVDVTDQVVDLQARMDALRAVEAAYVELLDQANGINDILTVQDRLTGIRTQIEQLQAQQDNVRGEAAFSTITAFITEPAPVGAEVAVEEEPTELTGWDLTWDRASNGFAAVVGAIVIAAVVLSPVLAIGAVLGLVAWVIVRRRRRLRAEALVRNRPAPPSQPAPAVDHEPIAA